MDIAVYKLLHVIGVILVVQSLGVSLFSKLSRPETRPETGSDLEEAKSKKMLGMMHGAGLFLILLGGFGMLAKLGVNFPFPIWTWLKVTIWIVLGASPILVKKRPESARVWWAATLVLAAFAAYLGLFKPL